MSKEQAIEIKNMLVMVEQELCFGGDWEGAKATIDRIKTKLEAGYRIPEQPDKLREAVAEKLAIQTLEDESLAGCYVWQWVIDNGFVEEYLQKADQILSLFHYPELKVLSDEKIRQVYSSLKMKPPEWIPEIDRTIAQAQLDQGVSKPTELPDMSEEEILKAVAPQIRYPLGIHFKLYPDILKAIIQAYQDKLRGI